MNPEKEKMWGYIGGIIDGEGHVYNPKYRPSGGLHIANTDLNILNKINNFLNHEGVNTSLTKNKKYSKKHKQCYKLQISGYKNLEKILKNCILSVDEKVERLEVIVNTGYRKEKEKRERINRFMKMKIGNPNLSYQKIGKILHENPSNILYRWGGKKFILKKQYPELFK